MRFIAVLYLHSKYSRDMEVESLARWARKKGISLLGTGDFTHPTYFAELQAKLTPAEPGLYRLGTPSGRPGVFCPAEGPEGDPPGPRGTRDDISRV